MFIYLLVSSFKKWPSPLFLHLIHLPISNVSLIFCGEYPNDMPNMRKTLKDMDFHHLCIMIEESNFSWEKFDREISYPLMFHALVKGIIGWK